MKMIEVRPDQTIMDIAIQEYGTLDGVYKLLEDNQYLAFDYTVKLTDHVAGQWPVVDGYEIVDPGFTDISFPLVPGQTIAVDEAWEGRDKLVINRLSGVEIVTGYAVKPNN